MKKQTIQLTTGALMVAIFGMILLLDRQTGRMLESIFLIIFPIPMVVYTTKYGLKAGVPVFMAMSLISLIFASPMMIFYGVTQALVGLIFGAMVQKRANMTQTLFVVILMTIVFTIMDFFVLSALMGNDILAYIDESMPEMQEMMRSTIQRYNSERAEQVIQFMTADVLKEVMVIVVVIEGIIQGFLVFEISLLLMNRLRMPVAKPKSIFLYFPPLWFGYLVIVVFCIYFVGYNFITSQQIRLVVQALGFSASYTLAFFGFLGVMLWVRTKLPGNRWLGPLLGVLCFVLYAFVLDIIGVIYLTSGYHERWLRQLGMLGTEEESPNPVNGGSREASGENGQRRSAYGIAAKNRERSSDRGSSENAKKKSITDIARMMEKETPKDKSEE